jgi:GMP synthase-like glutamine amidotransferase
MNIVVLQHEPFEGPALIAEWASERGHALRIAHLHRGEPLPELNACDWIVSMGGAISVNDEDALPWLAEEKALIRRAIQQDKRVLGVCLGAQMIASALGASVHSNSEREIGWWPIKVADEGRQYLQAQSPTVLHWHGETFELPPRSALLASSEACRNQAFAIGERVVGLQFHLECTAETVREFLAAFSGEMEPGQKWVQSARQMQELETEFRAENRTMLWALLDGIERG